MQEDHNKKHALQHLERAVTILQNGCHSRPTEKLDAYEGSLQFGTIHIDKGKHPKVDGKGDRIHIDTVFKMVAGASPAHSLNKKIRLGIRNMINKNTDFQLERINITHQEENIQEENIRRSVLLVRIFIERDSAPVTVHELNEIEKLKEELNIKFNNKQSQSIMGWDNFDVRLRITTRTN